MLETKEKYVTEEMLERAFVRFGETFGKSLRKEIAEDTKKIVEVAIDDFAVIVLKHFDRIDKRLDGIDGRLDGIDIRLDGMDERFDGMDRRFDRIEARFDNHLLDCVRRDEHKKLEKRVGSIELTQRKLAA